LRQDDSKRGLGARRTDGEAAKERGEAELILVMGEFVDEFLREVWVAEESATAGDHLFAGGVGEEAEVPDAHEALREDVEEKATEELLSEEGADADLIAALGVTEAEGNVVGVDGDEAGVGDGDAMGVAGEVLEDGERRSKGWFGVDDPGLLGESSGEVGEGDGVGEMSGVAIEAEAVSREGGVELADEVVAEDDGEKSNGEEEAGLGMDPRRTIEGETAGGNDAVDVGMVSEALGPGVKDGEEAEASAKKPGISSELEEGVGGGGEEGVVEDAFVDESEASEVVRESEDDVEVRDRQEVTELETEPLGALPLKARGAMAVATGEVGVTLEATGIAALTMPFTESSGSADGDPAEDGLLSEAESDEKMTEPASNITDGEVMRGGREHRPRVKGTAAAGHARTRNGTKTGAEPLDEEERGQRESRSQPRGAFVQRVVYRTPGMRVAHMPGGCAPGALRERSPRKVTGAQL
jgi:hypothetical protein